jgi:hypothetical protein
MALPWVCFVPAAIQPGRGIELHNAILAALCRPGIRRYQTLLTMQCRGVF